MRGVDGGWKWGMGDGDGRWEMGMGNGRWEMGMEDGNGDVDGGCRMWMGDLGDGVDYGEMGRTSLRVGESDKGLNTIISTEMFSD